MNLKCFVQQDNTKMASFTQEEPEIHSLKNKIMSVLRVNTTSLPKLTGLTELKTSRLL